MHFDFLGHLHAASVLTRTRAGMRLSTGTPRVFAGFPPSPARTFDRSSDLNPAFDPVAITRRQPFFVACRSQLDKVRRGSALPLP